MTEKTTTEREKENYEETGFERCPHCFSLNIWLTTTYSQDLDITYPEVTCYDCGAALT